MKLDPVERQSILFELENVTNYSSEYLDGLKSEELLKLYKERCQNIQRK